MTTHEHSHGHTHAVVSLNKIFLIGIALNLSFVAAEFLAGCFFHSMGLLSDAGHNLSDVVGLAVAMLAFRLAKIRSSRIYTYGYRKTTILASLFNAVILLVAVGVIIAESVEKIIHPRPVEGDAIMIVAGIGVVINGFTAWLFLKDKDRDLNVKGAYLHMAADALVSVGVVVSGLIITSTGWQLIDPLAGLAVAGVIVYSTWNLLHDSIRLSLDGIPTGIDRNEIETLVRALNGVEDIHHLHIWALSTTETALTAHIVIRDLAHMESIKQQIKHLLSGHAVSHVTLEFESSTAGCIDTCP